MVSHGHPKASFCFLVGYKGLEARLKTGGNFGDELHFNRFLYFGILIALVDLVFWDFINRTLYARFL
jgi:hypothetical protein